MLDYENIQSSRGMQGFNYLMRGDKIYLFYSISCSNIRHEYIEHINREGCEFHIIKLKQSRKNALDFYIATKAGVLAKEGESQIAIISGDKGLRSIADYFGEYEAPSIKVVVDISIEKGLLALDAPDDAERRNKIRRAAKNDSIEVEHARIGERQKMRNTLEEMFLGTPLESKVGHIISFYEASQNYSLKQKYTQSLHWFGKAEGLQVYQKLKGCN